MAIAQGNKILASDITTTSVTQGNLIKATDLASLIGETAITGQYINSLLFHGVLPFSLQRKELAATSVGNYALFGGGWNWDDDGDYISNVDIYNTSLVHSTARLGVGRNGLAATTIGNYALFGGGDAGGSDYSQRVDAYNTSLTRTKATDLVQGREDLAATAVGNYALFGGGYRSGYYNARVDTYNTSLTHSTATNFDVGRANVEAATVGNYALFAGGSIDSSTYSNAVDAYNTSLTHSLPTALTTAGTTNATSISNYALFAITPKKNPAGAVVAYNTSLTRTIASSLPYYTPIGAATSLNNYAIFIANYHVILYNTSLTQSVPMTAGIRCGASATSIGKYALFNDNMISDSDISAYGDVNALAFDIAIQPYQTISIPLSGTVSGSLTFT